MMAVNCCATFRLETVVLRGLDTAARAAADEAIRDIRRSVGRANRFADEVRQLLAGQANCFADEVRQLLAGQANCFADEVRQLLAGQSSEIKTLLFPRRI
jgi:ABC-type transporter Mla subunit MlaD